MIAKTLVYNASASSAVVGISKLSMFCPTISVITCTNCSLHPYWGYLLEYWASTTFISSKLCNKGFSRSVIPNISGVWYSKFGLPDGHSLWKFWRRIEWLFHKYTAWFSSFCSSEVKQNRTLSMCITFVLSNIPLSLISLKKLIQKCTSIRLSWAQKHSIRWLLVDRPYMKLCNPDNSSSWPVRSAICSVRTMLFSVPRSHLSIVGTPLARFTCSKKNPAMYCGLLLLGPT